jgi:hypothetical protein
MMQSADSPPQISRSAVLVGAAAALVACTERKAPAPTPSPSPRPVPSGGPTPTPTPSADPAVTALVTAGLGRETVLLAAYDAAIAGSPRLRAVLRRFRAHHHAHAERLRALLPGVASPAPIAPPPSTEADERRTLRRLVAAEERASTAAVSAAATAPTGELAALVAEIAGSEVQHAALLRTVRPRTRR